jgi:hypothetical protein
MTPPDEDRFFESVGGGRGRWVNWYGGPALECSRPLDPPQDKTRPENLHVFNPYRGEFEGIPCPPEVIGAFLAGGGLYELIDWLLEFRNEAFPFLEHAFMPLCLDEKPGWVKPVYKTRPDEIAPDAVI